MSNCCCPKRCPGYCIEFSVMFDQIFTNLILIDHTNKNYEQKASYTFIKAKKYVYYVSLDQCVSFELQTKLLLAIWIEETLSIYHCKCLCKINVKSVPKFIFLYRKTCD